MQKSGILILFLGLILSSCNSLHIIDKPITYDEERKELSLIYLEKRYGIIKNEPSIDPQMIVVHWTAIAGFEKSFNAFNDSKLPNSRADITSAGALNVSAQFLVDQNGKVYRLLPETTMARHVIGLNHCAIGIENVGGTPDMPLTKKQLKSNIRLIKYLKKQFPKIDYVIGHFEYNRFEDHPLWLEIDKSYRTEKTDPGLDFIETIRESTSYLNWEPVPDKL